MVRQATVSWWHCSSGGSCGWVPAERDSAEASPDTTGIQQCVCLSRKEGEREGGRHRGRRRFSLFLCAKNYDLKNVRILRCMLIMTKQILYF